MSVKRRRADNPKYRRIVPRGRVAIRRQFILKSRGIGRDWSGESGAATFVKYSRGGGGGFDPEGFSTCAGEKPKAASRKGREKTTVLWVGLSPANRRAFSSSPPLFFSPPLSRLFSRLPCHPFTSALFFSPPPPLHAERGLIREKRSPLLRYQIIYRRGPRVFSPCFLR